MRIFDSLSDGGPLGKVAKWTAYAFNAAFTLAHHALQRVGAIGLDSPLVFSESVIVLAVDANGNLQADIPITGEIRSLYFEVLNAAGVVVRGAFVSEMSIGAVQIYRHQGATNNFDPPLNGAPVLPYQRQGFLRRYKVIQGQSISVNINNNQVAVDVTCRLIVEMYGANVDPDFGVFTGGLWWPRG